VSRSFVVVPRGPSPLRSRTATMHRTAHALATCASSHLALCLRRVGGWGGEGLGAAATRKGGKARTPARSRVQPCTSRHVPSRSARAESPHTPARHTGTSSPLRIPLVRGMHLRACMCVYVHGAAAPRRLRVGRPRRPSCVTGLRAELGHPCASFRSACLVHSPQGVVLSSGRGALPAASNIA